MTENIDDFTRRVSEAQSLREAARRAMQMAQEDGMVLVGNATKVVPEKGHVRDVQCTKAAVVRLLASVQRIQVTCLLVAVQVIRARVRAFRFLTSP